MKIEIEVKPGTARRIAMIGATFVVLGAAAAVYANQVHFSNGQTLTATDLNTNFDELYARTVVTANGKSMSVNAVYCGATTATYNGNQIAGYSGGKAKCEATCGAATAHMCSIEELNRSMQLGVTVGTRAWISNLESGSYYMANCSGWTAQISSNGEYWEPTTSEVRFDTCSSFFAIACCN